MLNADIKTGQTRSDSAVSFNFGPPPDSSFLLKILFVGFIP